MTSIPKVLQALEGKYGLDLIGILSSFSKKPPHAFMFLSDDSLAVLEDLGLAFSASLVCENGGCATCADCRNVLNKTHVDLLFKERSGRAMTVAEAREIIKIAHITPLYSKKRIILIPDFHLVEEAGPALLKTLEEPPPTTIFLLGIERIDKSMSTLLSRCVLINATSLEVRSKDQKHDDFSFWESICDRLEKNGAAISLLANEIKTYLDKKEQRVKSTQSEEIKSLEISFAHDPQTLSQLLKDKEEVFKKELRKQRYYALESGLKILMSINLEAIKKLDSSKAKPEKATKRAQVIYELNTLAKNLVRNPNEDLLLLRVLILQAEVT